MPSFSSSAVSARIGPSGSGQITKMMNQMCIAGIVQGLAEALNLGQRAGLDMDKAMAELDEERAEVKRCVDIFRGQIVDVSSTGYTVQITGETSKLDAFIAALPEADIVEVARTGVSGLSRGEKSLRL